MNNKCVSIDNNIMGNCQQSNETIIASTFSDGNWTICPTTIHPCCFLLQSCSYPYIRLLRWMATSTKKNMVIGRLRQQFKFQFFPNVYEGAEGGKSGGCRSEEKEEDDGREGQKKFWVFTEELMRLRDTVLSMEDAVIVAYQSLQGFQELRKVFGGFVARQDMIFVNKSGAVKIWINGNLANGQPQFPHPTITEEQFISSLLHQIFANIRSSSGNDYAVQNMEEYLKSGEIKFNEILSKLQLYITQHNLPQSISVDKQLFEKMMKGDEKQNLLKLIKDSNVSDKKECRSPRTLKFRVAEGQLQNHCTFVKDYSKKSTYDGQLSHKFNQTFNGHSVLKKDAMNSSAPSNLYRSHYVLINQSFSP